MPARPSQIAVLCSVAGGFALLGTSVHGLVGLDGRLEAAARPVQIQRTVEIVDRHDGTCPFREAEAERRALPPEL